MATHSSILAWEIPGTEKPGGLPSMRSQTVRHVTYHADWSDLNVQPNGLAHNLLDLIYIPKLLLSAFKVPP